MARRLIPLIVLIVIVTACSDSDTGTTSFPPPATTARATPPTTLPPVTRTTAPPTSPPGTSSAPQPSTSTTPDATSTTVATTTTSTTLPSRPLAWYRFETTGDGPGARSNPVFVVDSEGTTAFLHGGRSGGEPLDDVWALDLIAGTWMDLTPEGERPSARFSHTGVWDQRRGRMVVFSGQRGAGEFFSDVWTFDPATTEWRLLADDRAGPENRYGSCAGYDPAGDRFLISHGFTDDGRFDDTWAFSLAEATWSDVSPASDRPLRRCLHTCSYDPAAQALVLFGGQSNEAFHMGDTWVLADGAWSEVAGTGPSARRFPGSVGTVGAVFVMGGTDADGATADTWGIVPEAEEWFPVEPDGAAPARHSHGAAFDAADQRLIVFGGEGVDGELSDVWILEFPSP